MNSFGDTARDDGRRRGRENELEEKFRHQRNARPVERGEHALVGGPHGGAVVGAHDEKAVCAEQGVSVAEHQGEPDDPEGEG